MSKKSEVELTEVSTSSPKKGSKERRSSEDQTNGKIKPILRHTQSHSSQRRPPSMQMIPTIEVISEEEQSKSEDVQTLSASNLQRKISTASGLNVKSPVRESARSNQSTHSQGSSVNRGFESNSDGDVLSYQSRYSSNQSLSTYKEQYCCSPNCRYTPRERKLCASVGVLAAIIVILVTVVGYLADQKGGA